MERIISYIQDYGPSIIIIAICIIAFVGILKLCKVFDKIKSSQVKKVLYYVIDVVLAFGVSAIYFAIFHKSFSGTGYVMYSVSTLVMTTTLYAVYENFGLRTLVKMAINGISKWFEKNPEAKLTKWAKKFGLVESLNKIQALVDEEKAKIVATAKIEQPDVTNVTDTTTTQN